MKLLSTFPKKELEGKRVIVRGDLDVSDISENDIRLQRLVPTVKYLLDSGAEVILMGHRGRPNGKVDEKYSLMSLIPILEKMLGTKNGWDLKENLRFDKREEENSEVFAKELVGSGDIYVNEAFSVCHRKHTSIVGIPKFLPSYAGLNLEKEITNLNRVVENPKRPLVILLSGIKEDKLKMVEPLSKIADKVLVGGRLPDLMGDKGLESVRLQGDERKIIVGNLIMDKEDITLNTIDRFVNEVLKAGTVVLAGVLGKCEDEGHSQGTKKVFQAVANSKAFKVVGGGDSLVAVTKYNLENKFDWISVGGGAMIKYLLDQNLPGIEALSN